jgi:hypothetical protein
MGSAKKLMMGVKSRMEKAAAVRVYVHHHAAEGELIFSSRISRLLLIGGRRQISSSKPYVTCLGAMISCENGG